MKFKISKLSTSDIRENLVIVTSDKLDFAEIAEVTKKYVSDIKTYCKNAEFKGEARQTLTIPTRDNKVKKIFLVGIGKERQLSEQQFKEAGASIFNICNNKDNKSLSLHFMGNISSLNAAFILMGMKLKSYFFNKFITKKIDQNKCHIGTIKASSSDFKNLATNFKDCEIIADGVELAKMLSDSPPNLLYPETFAEQCKDLSKHGVKVEILSLNDMQKLGMGAIIGVAQGSSKEPKIVIMSWNGGKKEDKPLAFLGKGVTFDSGGLSLKPANGMIGMKYDMSGAAVVTGLIQTLAQRKAKINALGVIGLVENMPDGNAQRPEDIVTSMSGQTIEVLNTDAEGRLVLADILWFTQERFKPKFMINLATLTGAIIVTFAEEYAGLFSNNDKLANQLTKAGIKTGEKLWRLPLAKEYDEMIDSKKADMQNIGSGNGAGSIVAAQFLQRFVNNVPWVHLDIAGVDNVKSAKLHQSGSTGFGVQLLSRFIADNYE